ncbi:hypothetical protein [Streptomyces kronopolitis]
MSAEAQALEEARRQAAEHLRQSQEAAARLAELTRQNQPRQ